MEIRLFYAGDSTVKENNYSSFPQTGMGQALGLFLNKNVRIVNCAQNGRSTRSFIDEGRLENIEKAIQKGDYLFIQFGHNDEKADEARHTEPYGSYQENLTKFVEVARTHGAHPLLITPISRRKFQEDGIHIVENNHLEYPAACMDIAAKLGVPVIDMNSLTIAALEAIGDEASKEWYLHVPAGKYDNFPNGKEDDSHLRYEGAYRYCKILVEELKKIGGVYADILLDGAAEGEDPALLID